MPRFPTLTHDELDALIEAHARLCTEWEIILTVIGSELKKDLKSEVKIINENLDIINDMVRHKRRKSGGTA